MRKIAMLLAAIGLGLPAIATAPAQATSSRTWVSGTGTDSGTCNRAAPCATFAFALTQTSAGGEVNLHSGENTLEQTSSKLTAWRRQGNSRFSGFKDRAIR